MITIIDKFQVYYLRPEDILYIKKGERTLPSDYGYYVEVYLKKHVDGGRRLEIDDIQVKELHSLLSSGKHQDIKKVFRRV